MSKIFKLTVATIKDRLRCVYVNNYRLVGSEPYVSEGPEYKNLEFTLDDLRSAFPELEISPTPQPISEDALATQLADYCYSFAKERMLPIHQWDHDYAKLGRGLAGLVLKRNCPVHDAGNKGEDA